MVLSDANDVNSSYCSWMGYLVIPMYKSHCFWSILMTKTNSLMRWPVHSTVFLIIFGYRLNRCGQFPCPACFILTPLSTLQDEPVPRSKRTVDQSKTSCLLHLHVDYLFYQRFGSIEAVVAQVNPEIQYTQVIQPKCNLDRVLKINCSSS